jgi:hypothetical protein
MAAVPFPPRGAGKVLADALAAAVTAAEAEAERQRGALREPWGAPAWDPRPALRVEQAAADAASPILRGLTADPKMVGIIALGMAAEVMIRLRKRGVA